MRLIDADALFAEEKEHHDLFDGCSSIGDTARRDELCNIMADIVNAPTIGGWISVKDRLPEEKQFVLVYGESLRPYKRDASCMAVSLRVDYNYWYGLGRTGEITHWMPLPEPPKEEE